jgi:cell shape-determining protein MreC
LIVPSLVEATVLGDVVAEQWRSGLLLDQGRVNGVRESALVVKGRRQLIDIGEDAALSPEDTLLLGRSVIGKVERVGRWTSAILLLTDPRYRGSARLIHEGDAGFEFGAHGVLKGRGEATCRLEGVASTEKVCEGDGVYSMSRESGVDAPLYYGRVVKAVLEPGEKEWLVEVEPASLPGELKTVQVLRSTLRPSRLEYAQRMTDE